jgi:hypothetical protein
MRRARLGWVAAFLLVGSSCGGSTDNGGSGGKGGSPGGTGGTAGTGAIGTTGGTGNVAGTTGGTGGTCVTTSCGPAGSACCDPSAQCAFSNTACTCTPELVWSCVSEGGGYGGTGAMGGFGGVGGCVDTGCGPQGGPCCSPGMGCGTSAGGGPGTSCVCTAAGYWDCAIPIGGAGGTGGMTGCGGTSGCQLGLTCCAGTCVNTANDPYNCGACGNTCAAYPPFCSGVCEPAPCFNGAPPPPGGFCCGQQFCTLGQLCCDVQGPGPSTGPVCFTPTAMQWTCPVGCPSCA